MFYNLKQKFYQLMDKNLKTKLENIDKIIFLVYRVNFCNFYLIKNIPIK